MAFFEFWPFYFIPKSILGIMMNLPTCFESYALKWKHLGRYQNKSRTTYVFWGILTARTFPWERWSTGRLMQPLAKAKQGEAEEDCQSTEIPNLLMWPLVGSLMKRLAQLRTSRYPPSPHFRLGLSRGGTLPVLLNWKHINKPGWMDTLWKSNWMKLCFSYHPCSK